MREFIPNHEGGTVYYWAQQAINEAKKENVPVMFKFNKIDIIVYPESFVADIAEVYNLTKELNSLKRRIY